jgi:hypothetical protein
MSGSPEPIRRRLIADTETPGTEIFVIDAAGEVVARAVRTLDEELNPGVYKLRFRVGNKVTDELCELPAGDGVFRVDTPRLPFETPAPILRLGDEGPPEQARIARDWSLETPLQQGSGSRLFVFADVRAAGTSAVDLELRRFHGDVIAENSENGKFQVAPQRFIGCHVELDPGCYLLRSADIEQTIVTAAGWQTQVFVPIVEGDTDWHADLSASAILMARIGVGFERDAPFLRWTEAAREALAAGRGGAGSDRELMNFLLSDKFEHPILGILGAHLVLLQESMDTVLLAEIVQNLERLVPGHPDVAALFYDVADQRAASTAFAEPPMLRSSWSRILQHSSIDRDPFPPRSYAAQIAGTLWGSGAWLTWRTPDLAEGAVASADPRSDLDRFLAYARAGKLPQEAEAREDLTPIERILLAYAQSSRGQLDFAKNLSALLDRDKSLSWVYPVLRRAFPPEFERTAKKKLTEILSPEQLALVTGIPFRSLADAAASLLRKLGLRKEGPAILEAIPRLPETVATVKSWFS